VKAIEGAGGMIAGDGFWESFDFSPNTSLGSVPAVAHFFKFIEFFK
jgi:hypothetical protein